MKKSFSIALGIVAILSVLAGSTYLIFSNHENKQLRNYNIPVEPRSTSSTTTASKGEDDRQFPILSSPNENTTDAVFQMTTSGGLTGNGSGTIVVFKSGEWIRVQPSYGEKDPRGDSSSGKLSEALNNEFQRMISQNALKIYTTYETPKCKPSPPDSIYVEYSYKTKEGPVSFDSCFLAGNIKEPLFLKTVEVINNINSQS